MYETLFDINELSDLGLLFNILFFSISFLVYGLAIAIAWKIKVREKFLASLIVLTVSTLIFMQVRFYLVKDKYANKLNKGEFSVAEGTIEQVSKKGKSTYFSVGKNVFRIFGMGAITPCFNDKNLIQKLHNEKHVIRISHIGGNILILEKYQPL